MSDCTKKYRPARGRHAHYPYTTDDDQAIVALVARGATNAEIGAALGRSEWAVKWRRRLLGIGMAASR